MAPDGGALGQDPGLLAIALYAALFGAGVGAVFGAGRGLALPRGSLPIGRWVLGNAIGWAVGLPTIYVAASLGAD